MVETYGKEEESETTTTNPTTAEDDMTLFLHHLLSTSSSSCSPMPLENSLKQIQTPFLSSSSSSSLSSSSSDVALALAAGRAAGIIPQSGWEVFCNVKTLHPTPPPPLLHPLDSGNHRRPPLPTDVNRRDVAYTAESSAALDISGDRSASSTGNFSLVPTAGDDSDKKAGPFVTDSSNPCSIGSLLDRQDSLCLPSSGGSLGSPVKDLVSGKRRKPPDTDLDDLDCESEEGQEVLEEPSKPVPSRNNLKRSRAAEVHNLSEKRRRSRINEKMKALQNLIPNSNKTDKASMLDEAIEYLKHLQLQVQMLSMRNGLNLSTMYMPGGLQPMQMPQTRMGFGIENDMSTQVNMGLGVGMGMGMLPTNQGPSTHPQFSLSNQCTPSHQPMVVPNLPGATTSENSFGMDPSRPHLGTTYQLPTAEEIYRVGSGILPHQQLDMIQSGRNHSAENKSKRAVPSLSLDGQAAMLEGGDCLEVCTILHGENSQQMLSGNIDERVLIQHMNDLKTEAIIPDDCVKKEARDF